MPQIHTTHPDQRSPRILYEDSHILVCAKPHGLAVQNRRAGSPDMESLLKTYLVRQGQEPYLAVVHRLDQPVSGLLVFGKTKRSAASLNAQLTGGSFGKHYRALADGCPPAPSGTLQDYLVKDGRSNTSRVCSPDTPGAKKAVLEYRTISGEAPFFPDAEDRQTELEIHLLTGRHHQIRVQMAHVGCPLAGDTKYNPAALSHSPGSWQVLRLCAFRLEFLHPVTGKKMRFCLEKDV